MKFIISLYSFIVLLFNFEKTSASILGKKCAFECASEGIKLQCSYKEMRCFRQNEHYNKKTGHCEQPNCSNMNCVGKDHEYFSNAPVRSSEEACELQYPLTITDNLGCVCNEGFCRENGVCVRRTVPKSEIDYSQVLNMYNSVQDNNKK
jgi:hypothetical protein